MAAIALVGIDALERVSERGLHVRDQGWPAYGRHKDCPAASAHVRRTAALGVGKRGGDGGLDAELVRPVRLALAPHEAVNP